MSMPSPEEALACGSASMTSTFFSSAASEAARLIVVVVFPTPPFWLANAMTFPIEILALTQVRSRLVPRFVPAFVCRKGRGVFNLLKGGGAWNAWGGGLFYW